MRKLTKAEQARIDHALAQIDQELALQLNMEDAMRTLDIGIYSNETLERAAKLLKTSFEIDIDGGLIYRGVYYPDRVVLASNIMLDLAAHIQESKGE